MILACVCYQNNPFPWSESWFFQLVQLFINQQSLRESSRTSYKGAIYIHRIEISLHNPNIPSPSPLWYTPCKTLHLKGLTGGFDIFLSVFGAFENAVGSQDYVLSQSINSTQTNTILSLMIWWIPRWDLVILPEKQEWKLEHVRSNLLYK